MSGLTSLPEEVLKLILRRVPLHHRLSNCCLVSKRLHAAAVAATDDVALYSAPQRLESLLDWVSHYGQHLTRLCLELGHLSQPLQLHTCKDLLELKLTGSYDTPLGGDFGLSGVIQGCTKLTRLELACNVSNPEAEFVNSLCSLMHLQHLEVTHSPGGQLPAAALPRFKHLTYLHFVSLSVDSLVHLGGLTDLQELHLVVNPSDYVSRIGPCIVPGLSLPASLTKLVLLSVVEADLLSLVPSGLQDLTVNCEVFGPEQGPGSFLSYVGQMQHLTRLSFQRNNLVFWPPPGPAYSALTANSKLVSLELLDTWFPQGIWPHVFPASRKLPHLTSFVLWGSDDDGQFISPPPLCAADVGSFVSCCPSLVELETDRMQPGLHVSELHKLTALTHLYLGYYDLDSRYSFDECVRGITALNQLLYLNIDTAGAELATSSLLPLTSLTTLTEFSCELSRPGGQPEVLICAWTQAGSAPDVWLQLLDRCAAEPDSQLPVLRSLAQQLAEQRTLTTGLQQQVSDQQQQVAGLRELTAAQQQQIAGLQEQASAQQQVAAEARAQVAVLQAQVQQLLQHLQQ